MKGSNHKIYEITNEFKRIEKIVLSCLGQIDESVFFTPLTPKTNSIAVLIKHLSGNMNSRWKEFRIADGEKAYRDREKEFNITSDDTMHSLILSFNLGWELLFAELEKLKDDDLDQYIIISGKELTINQTMSHHIMHYSYHVGQIIHIAKCIQGDKWRSDW
jgi:hypothetical protein